MEEKDISFDAVELVVEDLCGYVHVSDKLLADDDPTTVAIVSKLFGDAVNDPDIPR